MCRIATASARKTRRSTFDTFGSEGKEGRKKSTPESNVIIAYMMPHAELLTIKYHKPAVINDLIRPANALTKILMK